MDGFGGGALEPATGGSVLARGGGSSAFADGVDAADFEDAVSTTVFFDGAAAFSFAVSDSFAVGRSHATDSPVRRSDHPSLVDVLCMTLERNTARGRG